MKNIKVLVISIIIGVIIIVSGISGFLYYQNVKNNQEEYSEAVKKYERIEKVAIQVNDVIDKKLIPTQEFLATNPDVRRR